MIEPLVEGRELTVGVLQRGPGLAALPLIEIVAASGVYDYAAKYERDDTRYNIRPELPAGVAEHCARSAVALARAMGIRHLCRVDFLLDRGGAPWLLEVNTMPGFTSHSLVPMAAASEGMEMPALCAHLVRAAAARLAGV
jgi:D-alanine-D-alanine ligase